MFTVKIRKKLTTTITTIVITVLAAWFASKGLDLSPEQQLTLIKVAGAIIGLVVASFNIGQGIADKGKEIPK